MKILAVEKNFRQKKGFTRFELMEIRPYTGFERMFMQNA